MAAAICPPYHLDHNRMFYIYIQTPNSNLGPNISYTRPLSFFIKHPGLVWLLFSPVRRRRSHPAGSAKPHSAFDHLLPRLRADAGGQRHHSPRDGAEPAAAGHGGLALTSPPSPPASTRHWRWATGVEPADAAVADQCSFLASFRFRFRRTKSCCHCFCNHCFLITGNCRVPQNSDKK